MPLTIRPDCPACRHYQMTGDFFHSKEVWDRYHNSGWVDGKSDWQPREEIKEFLDRMKKVWKEVEHFKGEVKTIPEWQIKKIMSKRG